MRDPGRTTTRNENSTDADTIDGRYTDERPANDGEDGTTSRRRLLFVSGSVLVGSALSTPAAADHENHFELGGRTSHWAGEEPSEIAGEENPMITFTVGEEYTMTWHNRDGNYHKLLIQDEDRNTLENTPGNGEEDATESVTFVATEDMDRYQCEPHFSMRGDIQLEGSSPGADETPTETPTEEPTPTDEPTPTEEPTPIEQETATATEQETATATETPTEQETATESPCATPTGEESAAETPCGTGSEMATESPTETVSGDAATDTGTATQTDGSGRNESSPDEGLIEPEGQSVFGVGSVLTGAGGLAYLLRRRFTDDDE